MSTERSTTLLRSPGFWLATALAARHAVGVWNLHRTLRFLGQSSTPAPASRPPERKIHFVVPALREQAHIAGAMRWFTALLQELPGCSLTVVTTDREERERDHLIGLLASARTITPARFPQLGAEEHRALREAAGASRTGGLDRPGVAAVLHRFPLTREVVANLLTDPQLAALPIRHVVYPGDGRKAAQVNYAVAHLAEADPHDYIAVYDVDSRPELTLIRHTLDHLDAHRSGDGEPPAAIQQSARFTTTGAATRGWERALCRGSARVQTLWTLRRELPSLRRYHRATRHPTGRPALDAARRGLAQTVGHGLLVRLETFRGLGGLPEFTVLDDLPFGYRATVEGIRIEPVAAITTVPAPETVAELVSTHRRWFGNYLDYPACATAARTGGHGTPASRIVALGVAGYRGAAWALAGPTTLAATAALLAPRTRIPVRVVAAAGLWLGCVTPVRMLAAADSRQPTMLDLARDCGEVYAAYLLCSTGPLIALVTAPRRRRELFSPKTQRRSLPPQETP
jgi:hypothetical protein